MSGSRLFRTFKKPGSEADPTVRLMLRRRARQIETRQQFEEIVNAARHPAAVRRMLTPLLRPNLPCCVPNADDSHNPNCPIRKGAEAHA